MVAEDLYDTDATSPGIDGMTANQHCSLHGNFPDFLKREGRGAHVEGQRVVNVAHACSELG